MFRVFCALFLLSAAIAVPSASAQSRLQQPSFGGLFAAGNHYPQTLGRDGARGWNYFSNSGYSVIDGVAVTFIARVNDAGMVDPQWQMRQPFRIENFFVADDGSVFVLRDSDKRWYQLVTMPDGSVDAALLLNASSLPPLDSSKIAFNAPLRSANGSNIRLEVTSTGQAPYVDTNVLRRSSNQDAAHWATPILGTVRSIAVDDVGRTYLLGQALNIGGRTDNLLRVQSDGAVDPIWSANITPGTYLSSQIRVVSNRLIVADTVRNPPPSNIRVSTLNLVDGSRIAERVELAGVSGDIASDGSVLTMRPDGRPLVMTTSGGNEIGVKVLDALYGVNGTITAAVKWRGGYVVAGRFDYWFDGKLYRNFMQIDESFRPVPSWTPPIVGTPHALAVGKDGALIVGGVFTLGQHANLARFSSIGVLDDAWRPAIAGEIYSLAAIDDGSLVVGGAFSAVNGVERRSLAKFRADGSVDAVWASQPSWPKLVAGFAGFGSDGIRSITDAGASGILFVWEDAGMNSYDTGTVRLSREGAGDTLALPEAVAQSGGKTARDPATGIVYGNAVNWYLPPVGARRGSSLVRLLPPNLDVDPTWAPVTPEKSTDVGDVVRVTQSHIYVCAYPYLQRFDSATGAYDTSWNSNRFVLCPNDFIEWSANGYDRLLMWGYFSGGLEAWSTATLANQPRTVVEYYARDAKRFFITARDAEVAALDAMPAAFARTGMQFSATDAGVDVPVDASRDSVCRFYAPPALGGSNTHFYGRGADCQWLKRFSTLRWEGYGFRVHKPASGACPSAAFKPVFRMFNNLSASNNGNHRYVVSEARRAEMVGAGWMDEGVAFCTADAVDSRTLADVVR